MGLSLLNIGKKIGDVLGGVERQINPFDHGATYSNPRPQPAPQQQGGGSFVPNTSGLSRVTSGPSTPIRPVVVPNVVGGNNGTQGNDYRSMISKVWDQVNPLDNGRTWNNPLPTNTQPASQQLTSGLQNRFVKPIAQQLQTVENAPAGTVVRHVIAEVTHNKEAAQNANIGTAFKNALPPSAYVRDSNGKVVNGPDGKPKINPEYNSYIQNIAAGTEGGVKSVKTSPVVERPIVKSTVGKPVKVPVPTRVAVKDTQAARQAVAEAKPQMATSTPEPQPVSPREGKFNQEGGVRDRFGEAMIDKDTVIINTLKNIEHATGQTGIVSKFLDNSNMLRNTPQIAAHKFLTDPHIAEAVGGLSKGDMANFKDYVNARAELSNYDGKPTFRTPKDNKAIVEKFHPQFDGRFQALNNYYKGLAKDALDNGTIDADTYRHYTQNNDYVHLARDVSDLQTVTGKGKSYGLGSTFLKNKRTGSGRALLDPVGAALDFTRKNELEKWKNITATHIAQTLYDHGQATKLVDSEHVLARKELQKFLGDTREGKNVVDRTYKRMNRQLRLNQREVDALNKEGLNVSLKPRVDTRTEPTVQSRVRVTRSSDYKQVVDDLKKQNRWKPVQAAPVDEARTALRGSKWYNAYNGTTDALKQFAKSHGMTEDEALIHQYMTKKGVDAYLNSRGKEVLVNISKLERHAGKMASEGRFSGNVEDVRANTTKMGQQNTKRAVQQLLSVEPSELARIKNKLALREPRLKALIDQVEQLRNESEAFHTARRDAYLKARALSDQATKNKNTISILRNGAREVYEVSPEIKRVTQQIAPFTLGPGEKLLGAPARILRGGATATNPVFTASNIVKDQISSAILSRKSLATHNPKNIAAGLKESAKSFVGMKNDPLWHAFEEVGGNISQYDLTRNMKGTQDIINRVRGGRTEGARQALKHPLRTLEDANSITERATRFQNFKGTYEDAIKHGYNHNQALTLARTAALENTINFGRAGSWGRFINLLIPYSNAAIQGGRQLAKRTAEDPVGTIGKSAGWVGAPIAAATMWNTADPERKKIYENIDDFEKQNNLIIIAPGTKYKDVKGGTYNVVKIPLPPDIGNIWQPIRNVVESARGVKGAKVSPVQVAADVAKPFVGPVNIGNPYQVVGSLIPQGVKPFVQQAANKDFYTGKQVESGYLTDEYSNPTQRSTKSTSNVAQQLGKIFGVAPVRVDKFIKDTFGTTGTITVNLVDTATNKAGMNKTGSEGGTSVPDAFVRRFAAASAKTDPNNAAQQHFAAVDAEYQKLNKNDKAAYDTIHPSKVDGTTPDKTFYDAAERANIYKTHPNVLAADDRINKSSGDPFYKLPAPQQQVVLTLDTLSADPGNNSAAKIRKDNPWLQDYYNQRSSFFDGLAAAGKLKAPDGSIPQPPNPDANTSKLLSQYNNLPATEKSAFITANPSVSDYFAAEDQYQRTKRGIMGLPQFDQYPTPDANLQKKLDVYNSLPKHDGPKGGNKSRSIYIQANPEIADFFNAVSQYSLLKDSQMAFFQGEDLPAKDRTAASSGSSSSGSSSGSKYTNSYSSSGYGPLRVRSPSSLKYSKYNSYAYTIDAHGSKTDHVSPVSFNSAIPKVKSPGRKPTPKAKAVPKVTARLGKPKVSMKKN